MLHTAQAVGSLGDLLHEIKSIRQKWTKGWNPREEIWFRGQARLSDTLVPTLYRTNSTANGFHKKECSLLSDFRLRAKSLTPTSHLSEVDKWFWYVTARHHGLPSRLLDWSDNVLIALFFALESSWNSVDKTTWSEHRNSTHYSATLPEPPTIWVLEAASLNRVSQGIIATLSFETQEKCLPLYYPDSATGCIRPNKQNRLPIAMYPARLNARVHSQHSYFTLHGTDQRPIEHLASRIKKPRGGISLARIPIKVSRIPYLIDDLLLCGLTHASIYADLDSIAKTVKWSFMEQGALNGKEAHPKTSSPTQTP